MILHSVSRRGIWITSIVSNRVIYAEPGGQQAIIIEDADPEHLDTVEKAFLNGCTDRPPVHWRYTL